MIMATAPKLSLAPPLSVETYDFSLSRSTGKFRFRLDGDEWLCSDLVGKWEVIGNDGERGAMTVRCRLKVDGDSAYVYLPKDAEAPALPEGAHETHYRLCYNRPGRDWRLRDERTGNLTLVKDYRGVMNVNWLDGGTHIFHDGPVYVDAEGVAHFCTS